MKSACRVFGLAIVVTLIGAVLVPDANAQVVRRRRGPNVGGGGGSPVSLPHAIQDDAGNQWVIYQTGWMRQQGNMPLFGQAANLLVNESGLNSATNRATFDKDTGEIVFDDLSAGNLQITRRIYLDRARSIVRYIDIFKNSTAQDISITAGLNTNFNYQIQGSDSVVDPKRKQNTIGWVGQVQVGRAVVGIFGGRGAKTLPQVNAQPASNLVQASIPLTVPAGKRVALLSAYGVAANTDAGKQLIAGLKDADLLKGVPLDIRKIIVNVAGAQSIGDFEVLRDDMFDVVELRGGDQLKGTLAEKSYQLDTSYGPVELPAERVVGMINVGQFKPRQLIVTVDGEVFGGRLAKDSVALELSSGQTTQVPLAQVQRLGYRRRAGEPDEWTFDRPMVLLTSGDRMLVKPPVKPIEMLTRYGTFQLPPDKIASITFNSPDLLGGVHRAVLTDGSSFGGLVPAADFEFELISTAETSRNAKFAAASVARIQMSGKTIEELVPDDAATMVLSNQDQLVGNIAGQIKLETAFDTINIDGSQIRSLVPLGSAGAGGNQSDSSAGSGGNGGSGDVQVVLWDNSALSGQLKDASINCALRCGLTISVPVPLLDRYTNPQPRPSDSMVERVKTVVAQLAADDWKQREQAQAQLAAMGEVITPVLAELRPSQPPEAQQRIDAVLKQFETKPSSGAESPVLNKDE